MQKHSIKTKREYKLAANIIKDASNGIGSVKTLLYQKKHCLMKQLHALVSNTLSKGIQIDELLEKSKILKNEPKLDPWLARVLIYELIWGKKVLHGESLPIQTVNSYAKKLKAVANKSEHRDNDLAPVLKPRYVRVNTILTTTKQTINDFQNEGWTLKTYPKRTDYDTFLKQMSTLNSNEFMIDYHIPDLLIFPPKTNFYKHTKYTNGMIVLQDKASCLPVYLLDPKPGSTVLDMCAAPGMKTTHLAAMLNNEGKIYSVEWNKNRFKTLEKIAKLAGATCVEPLNEDVLNIKADRFPLDIDYILLDPTCTGSGILDRQINNQETAVSLPRFMKLNGLQSKMLRHALTMFPNAKRIVYSTCSLHAQENEGVVSKIIECAKRYKLVAVKELNGWKNYGSDEFDAIGERCIYARPEVDRTNGFFVAVFERLKDDEKNDLFNAEKYKLLHSIQSSKDNKPNNTMDCPQDSDLQLNSNKSQNNVSLKDTSKSGKLKKMIKTEKSESLASDVENGELEDMICDTKNIKKLVNKEKKRKNQKSLTEGKVGRYGRLRKIKRNK